MSTTPPPPRRQRPITSVFVGLCVAGTVAIILGATLAMIGWMGRTTDETFSAHPATGITGVEVRTTVGRIEVVGGDVDQITVRRRATWGLNKPRLDERVVDGRLVVSARCKPIVPGPCHVNYSVVVPRHLAVQARTSAGQLTVRGVDGGVDASSSAGQVQVVDVAGPLVLRTSAGKVTGDALRATHVDARNSAGPVELSFAAPPERVYARTSAGDVEIELPDDATTYRLDLRSPGGQADAAVRTDPASPRLIEARSSSGPVVVRYAIG